MTLPREASIGQRFPHLAEDWPGNSSIDVVAREIGCMTDDIKDNKKV